MSIEKKSLISTLKTTKKANVASAPALHEGTTKTEILKKNFAKKAFAKKAFAKKAFAKKAVFADKM